MIPGETGARARGAGPAHALNRGGPTLPTSGENNAPEGQRGHGGGDRKSERARADQVGNANLISRKGTTRADVLARLDRDRPELAARVRAGELSANAAAIAAGKVVGNLPTGNPLPLRSSLRQGERTDLPSIEGKLSQGEEAFDAHRAHSGRQRVGFEGVTGGVFVDAEFARDAFPRGLRAEALGVFPEAFD